MIAYTAPPAIWTVRAAQTSTMRVLWLCSTPALGAESVGARSPEVGGWVAALEAALEQHGDLDLTVAFPWAGSTAEATRGRHRYLPYPTYPGGGRLRQLLVDASCRLEPETEVRHLVHAVERSQPDLIHVWGTEGFFGLISEHTDRPVLIEIQGPRTPYTEIYCSALTRRDLLRHGSPKHLLNGRSLLHQYYRYRRSAVRERRILRRARYVSGRTDWDRSICAELAPQARYFHCDRVLRAPFYTTGAREASRNDELQIISTLRGNAYKGIETVVRCAAELRGSLPAGFRWTLVGIRPGEEIHRIVARKLGANFAAHGIELVGRQPAEQIAERLRASDLYVLPSRIENSPNGLAEAMAQGLPCIATDAGGTSSMVAHGSDALLIPPGDPQAMAAAIRQLAEEPELARRLGEAARARALERHDPASVVARLRSIYDAVLADHQTGGTAG